MTSLQLTKPSRNSVHPSRSIPSLNPLADDLRRRLAGEVRFDAGSRALYATDASNYRQVPIGVVIPKTVDDIVAAVAVCHEHGAPVLARGGGTSLAGQCCNVAVVIDTTKYLHHIVSLDPTQRRARVQPGLVLDDLRNAAEAHHLTFAPDPSTHSHNTLGGMIGNNSCGVHSMMGGRTGDNVMSLDVLLYDGTRLTVGATSDDEFARIIAAGGRRGEIYSRILDLRNRYAHLIRQRFPKIPRRVSGYGLDELLPENGGNIARALVGTEGTCVIVLEAEVSLVESPPVRSLLVLGYPDVFSAADHVPELRKYQPIGLEGIDDRLIEDMKAIGLHPNDVELLPPGGGWLMVEFGGNDREEADGRAREAMDALKRTDNPPSMKLFDDREEEKTLWRVRASGLGATAHVPNKKITWEGWEDAAVAPEKLGGYLRDFRALLERYKYTGDLYGHFGQGCVHTRIDFDLETADGIKTFRAFLEDATDLIVRYGGSFSGEHGDGQSKAEFLPKMYGPELIDAFREFKTIFDPDGKMNPGKVVDPFRADQNLRLGTGYNPPQPKTHFKFPKDQGNFGRVSLRCVGVGECRREHGGTMCPSYRVTREEMHSTRGRARLLFEMLEGEVIKDGWRSDAVREALDLCLACKGCKGDCPVSVDMATYKAEFLSHYYRRRLRPRHAYAFGLIDLWSRVAARAPGIVNALTHWPVVSNVTKMIAGAASERTMPTFAARTFVADLLRGRTTSAPVGLDNETKTSIHVGLHHENSTLVNADWDDKSTTGAKRGRVLLWPDTFNNHFYPETLKAAHEVLVAAGFAVTVPREPFCCGRPLYDFGMLDLAKRRLRHILSALHEPIANGVPVVVLEPACAAVFRDELENLFPGDEQAKRLSKQTFLFAEFLEAHAQEFKPPQLARRAIVHGHCHQKAIADMTADEKVMTRLGLDFETLDSGCCGMAGSFGFERGKFEISQQIGELVLLPAVRKAADETLIVADGFSCREQIAANTDRHPLHLAQVVQMALHPEQAPSPLQRPETAIVDSRAHAQRKLNVKTALWCAAGALVGLAALLIARHGKTASR